MANVTAYLCPEPWQPGGLKVRKADQARVDITKDDTNTTIVTVYLVSDTVEPSLSNANEVTAYLIKAWQDELDILFCGKTSEDEIHPSHRKVLDYINTVRQNSPLECPYGLGCSPLEYQKDLTYAAQVHASDMYLRAYSSPVTPEGLDGPGRITNAGVNAVQSEIVVAEVSIQEPRLTDAILQQAMESFFTPPHRIHMMNYLFTHTGFALFYDATEGAERWIFVVCLAWIEENESEYI